MKNRLIHLIIMKNPDASRRGFSAASFTGTQAVHLRSQTSGVSSQWVSSHGEPPTHGSIEGKHEVQKNQRGLYIPIALLVGVPWTGRPVDVRVEISSQVTPCPEAAGSGISLLGGSSCSSLILILAGLHLSTFTGSVASEARRSLRATRGNPATGPGHRASLNNTPHVHADQETGWRVLGFTNRLLAMHGQGATQL